MLIYLAILFCASVTAIQVTDLAREDVVYPIVETLRSGVKSIRFRALEQDVNLKLKPAGNLIADDFALIDGEGHKIDNPVDIEATKRKLFRDRRMGAALHIDEEGPLTIHGILNSKMRIEPHQSEETTKDGRIPHRVIEVTEDSSYFSDEIIPLGMKGGLANGTIVQRRDDQCIVVELLLITESKFTKSFYKRFNYHEALQRYLFNILIGAQNRLDTLNLGITIRCIGIQIHHRYNEAPYIKQSVIPENRNYLESKTVLKNMATYLCKEKDNIYAVRADAAILITKRGLADVENGSIDTDTLGIAYVGGVCDQCWKFAVVEDDGNSYHFDRFVHELAHILGSPHDEDPPVHYIFNSPGSVECLWIYGFLMSYERNSVNSTKFSICSRNNIANLLQMESANCTLEVCNYNYDYDNYYYSDFDDY